MVKFILSLQLLICLQTSAAVLSGVLYDSSSRTLAQTNLIVIGLRGTNSVVAPGANGSSNSFTALDLTGSIKMLVDKDGGVTVGSAAHAGAGNAIITGTLTLAGTNIQTTLSSLQSQVTAGGTVSSVAMTVPSDLSIGGSPITSSGTLAITRNTQAANKALLGPISGSAATPGYRLLDPLDIPSGIPAIDIGAGSVDNTELGYLDGVTSSIQSQINNIQSQVSGIVSTPSGTVVGGSLTSGTIPQSSGSTNLINSPVTVQSTTNITAPNIIASTNLTAVHIIASIDASLAGTNLQTTLNSLQSQISGFSGAPSGTVTGGSLTSGVIPVASGSTNLIDGYLTQSGGYVFGTNSAIGLGSTTNGLKILAINGGTITTATNLPALYILQRAQNASGFFTNIYVIIDDASYDLNHSKIFVLASKSRGDVFNVDYTGNVVAQQGMTAANFVTAGNITVGNGGGIITTSDGRLYFRADGVIQVLNNAGTDFTRVELGGSTIGGGAAIGYPSLISIKSAANSGNVPIINFANGAATTFAQATNFASIGAYDISASRNISAIGSITTLAGTITGNTVSGVACQVDTITLTNSIIPAISVVWKSGSGSPEGSVTSSIGGLYTRTDGGAGTTLYIKESGSGSTGWIAK